MRIVKDKEKYIKVLKDIDNWVSIREWVDEVATIHPDLFEEMVVAGAGWTPPNTGNDVLWRKLNYLTKDLMKKNDPNIEVSDKGKFKQIRYIENRLELTEETLTRGERIQEDTELLSLWDLHRIEEFRAVARSLNRLFKTDFEVDHSEAILSKNQPGSHHPNNLQLLSKRVNVIKGSRSWNRFSWDEQVDYIKKLVQSNTCIKDRLSIVATDDNLGLYLTQLELVYEEKEEKETHEN